MIPADARKLVELLRHRSESEQVNWILADESDIEAISASGEDDYVASWPEYSVNIWAKDTEGIGFAIVNSDGRQVMYFVLTSQDEDYETMRTILELARRKARGADKALQYLERQLA